MSDPPFEGQYVLDASALLAYLQNEPGARTAERYFSPAVISAINWAEVLSKLADTGRQPQEIAEKLYRSGFIDHNLVIAPFTEEDALHVAELRPLTRQFGLSLGDRACLALAHRLGRPAITTDRRWADLNVGLDIKVIR